MPPQYGQNDFSLAIENSLDDEACELAANIRRNPKHAERNAYSDGAPEATG